MKCADGEKVSTGTAGLDDVLGGGLPRNGIYLVQGNPGVGKTTLALKFLLDGSGAGGEGPLHRPHRNRARGSLRRALTRVGVGRPRNLGVVRRDPPRPAATRRGRPEEEQTLFHPAEVELEETTRPIFEEIERQKPDRVVLDSLSEIRLLSREPLRYRRQLLALKQFFLDRQCTVLMIDTLGMGGADSAGILETLIGGLILLEKSTPAYGTTRRRLVVDKLRGVAFREGYHDYQIKTGGVVVHPRLVAAEHPARFSSEPVSSGVRSLLLLHLRELLTFLSQKGVTTLMNMAQHGLLGPTMVAPIDVSYLADAVLLLRYFEAAGEVRQAISVVKKRSGRHERTIREFRLDHGGIRLGEPLKEFRGVLTGVPVYRGSEEPLLDLRK